MAVPRDEGKAAVRALYYSEWFLSDGTKAAYGDTSLPLRHTVTPRATQTMRTTIVFNRREGAATTVELSGVAGRSPERFRSRVRFAPQERNAHAARTSEGERPATPAEARAARILQHLSDVRS